VRNESTATPESLATGEGVPFRMLKGPVEETLLRALGDEAVIAAVLGARSAPGGRGPLGRTALHIIEGADKPIVVVPPKAFGVSPRRFDRLLTPLEGTHASARPVGEPLLPLITADVELAVLHVFTPNTMPRVLDRPARDIEMLGGEFLARYCPNATRVELRSGSIRTGLADVCREERPDLLVVSWSQDASEGHAEVIRWALGHSAVPILLLPVDNARARLPSRLIAAAGEAT